MKAWQIWLFIYSFQFILAIIFPYYNVAYETPIAVNISENVSINPEVVTTENQYLQNTLFFGIRSKNIWDILKTSIMPTGSFIAKLFPNIIPELLITLLNSIYYVLATLMIIEIMRGIIITGR